MRQLHHTHLMAADLDAAVAFYCDVFGGIVVADVDFAGARNVFMAVGGGRLHFYDQPPNHRGPVNHLGMVVDDLEATVADLRQRGFEPRPIKSDPTARYAMVQGPDGVLIEVFEPRAEGLNPVMAAYFGLSPDK